MSSISNVCPSFVHQYLLLSLHSLVILYKSMGCQVCHCWDMAVCLPSQRSMDWSTCGQLSRKPHLKWTTLLLFQYIRDGFITSYSSLLGSVLIPLFGIMATILILLISSLTLINTDYPASVSTTDLERVDFNNKAKGELFHIGLTAHTKPGQMVYPDLMNNTRGYQ